MAQRELSITYIGGPTALLDIGGLRLLTDPTFDEPGGTYQTGPVTLHKLEGPARSPEEVGPVDVVLLSHHHHFDNLDHAGRRLLRTAGRVLTTPEGAAHLGGNAEGLAAWQTVDMSAAIGNALHVTGTPARHGPADMDRGPVTGFVLAFEDDPKRAVYISGDTVWYDGVAEVSRRFDVRIAVLFLGAARVPAVGSAHLTMTAEEAVNAARAFPAAAIVPLHFEGWAHFSESRSSVEQVFRAAGLTERLRWPVRGEPTIIPL